VDGGSEHGALVRESAIFWGVALVLVALVAAAVKGAQVLLLTFFAVLLGTTLRGAAERTARRLHVRVAWGLVACCAALVLLIAIAVMWIVPSVGGEVSELGNRLHTAMSELERRLSRSSATRHLFAGATDLGGLLRQHLQQTTGFLLSAAGALGAALFVAVIALYVAASPDTYRRGALALLPAARRPSVAEVLDELAHAMRRWMLTRIVAMTLVGLATWLGLALLGVPLSAVLGLIAGVLEFVPNIGPLVAMIPGLLLAVTVSPMTPLYALVVYLVVGALDGYVLAPILQKRALETPPALVLALQLLFGAFWGIIGVLSATPLLGCALIVVRRFATRSVIDAADRA
jgi:predicted PurR-regulated permease PerM